MASVGLQMKQVSATVSALLDPSRCLTLQANVSIKAVRLSFQAASLPAASLYVKSQGSTEQLKYLFLQASNA
jgi:hypothetical protein